jgi:hypothetical protein
MTVGERTASTGGLIQENAPLLHPQSGRRLGTAGVEVAVSCSKCG